MKKENNYNCQFSLIVASKNSEKHIQNLINSFEEQTFKEKELIIIDSKSDDNTKKIIIKNENIISKFISEPDRGICDAWNKGIKLARGKWIIFFGADDTFYSKHTLEEVNRQISKVNKKYYLVYSTINVIDNEESLIGNYGVPWELTKRQFKSIMNIPHQGLFHRSSLFKEFGNFNINLKYAGDYDLCLRVIEKAVPQFIPNIIVSKMLYGGQSSLASHSWRVLNDFRKVRQNNGIKAITVLWVWIFIKSIIKFILSKIIGDKKVYFLIKFIKNK